MNNRCGSDVKHTDYVEENLTLLRDIYIARRLNRSYAFRFIARRRVSSSIDSKMGLLTSFQKRGRLRRKLRQVIDTKNKRFIHDCKKNIF